MVSCGTQQQLTNTQRAKFEEITSDICIKHQHEIRLAQALWVEMMKKK